MIAITEKMPADAHDAVCRPYITCVSSVRLARSGDGPDGDGIKAANVPPTAPAPPNGQTGGSGSAAEAQATGSPGYIYPVFGARPNSDTVRARMFLIHSETRELLWVGQVLMPAYFKHKQVVETTARKAAEQAPTAWAGQPEAAR